LELSGLFERIKTAFGTDSLSEIAKALDIVPQSVYQWQKRNPPSISTLIKISDLTGTSIHWLITGQGHQLIAERGVSEEGFQVEKALIGEIKRAAKEDGRRLVDEIAELIKAGLLSRSLAEMWTGERARPRNSGSMPPLSHEEIMRDTPSTMEIDPFPHLDVKIRPQPSREEEQAKKRSRKKAG